MPVINVTTNLPDRMIPQDGLLMSMAEHFDEFIVDYQMAHPSVWRDRIQKGTFPLFNGYSQKHYIYKGSLGPQSGLSGWTLIEPSRKPTSTDAGNDRCTYNPQTYTWAFDAVDFSGMATSWRSPVFCVNDLKFQDYAKEQLAYIIRSGAQVTDQQKETFNREIYVKLAADAGKFVVMAAGVGLDFIDSTTGRVTYAPATSTNITFAVALLDKVSTLNWSSLELIHQYLSDQCPDAAISNESGMPIFGLMLDLKDFENYVLTDNALREDFRMAIPQRLIAGFDMGFRTYRGFALMHDPRQMRYTFSTITAGSLVTLTRVNPRRATRAGVVGSIPEANPAYATAEFGTAIVFLNDALQILVPPVVNSLGTGTVFGPQTGFNGEWTWLNIRDEQTNPLGEKGYFFSRYEYFPKPMRNAQEVIVLLYRRCTQTMRTVCTLEDTDESVTEAYLGVAGTSADINTTTRTLILSLAHTLTAGVGAKVNVTNDAGNVFAAYIVSDADAPVYTLAWASGATNAPSAIGDVDDITKTKVAVV